MKEIKLLEFLTGKKVVLEENDKNLLIPRRTGEEREKKHIIAINKMIQEYIKNGSKGNLDLDNTPIEKLPDNLTEVGGSLWLPSTLIKELPDNLTIKGTLFLHFSKIKFLPKNLKIGDDLMLAGTSIKELPEDLQVKGKIYIKNTPLSENHELMEKYKQQGYYLSV